MNLVDVTDLSIGDVVILPCYTTNPTMDGMYYVVSEVPHPWVFFTLVEKIDKAFIDKCNDHRMVPLYFRKEHIYTDVKYSYAGDTTINIKHKRVYKLNSEEVHTLVLSKETKSSI